MTNFVIQFQLVVYVEQHLATNTCSTDTQEMFMPPRKNSNATHVTEHLFLQFI